MDLTSNRCGSHLFQRTIGRTLASHRRNPGFTFGAGWVGRRAPKSPAQVEDPSFAALKVDRAKDLQIEERLTLSRDRDGDVVAGVAGRGKRRALFGVGGRVETLSLSEPLGSLLLLFPGVELCGSAGGKSFGRLATAGRLLVVVGFHGGMNGWYVGRSANYW